MVEALIADSADPVLMELMADHELHAPTLLDFEVASALRGRTLGRKLTPARLVNAIADFQVLDVRRHQMTGALHEILDLRDNFTAYDAAYVVLAHLLDAPLVTADVKMKVAEKAGIEVRILDSSDMR
ncbi:VapC ribonuclease [Sphaerisporangium melleum]|uniref:VapC ribonuclease n=2 Tax=Sphaerisporangium melleum TaxID=321316 RepID=A0A917R1G6_9ACTN|nr:VapC ribonuclease [Sphaerisporangium melleum]GII69297.1 VapC ribonuclease [Sphaerisporangium melleum]